VQIDTFLYSLKRQIKRAQKLLKGHPVCSLQPQKCCAPLKLFSPRSPCFQNAICLRNLFVKWKPASGVQNFGCRSALAVLFYFHTVCEIQKNPPSYFWSLRSWDNWCCRALGQPPQREWAAPFHLQHCWWMHCWWLRSHIPLWAPAPNASIVSH